MPLRFVLLSLSIVLAGCASHSRLFKDPGPILPPVSGTRQTAAPTDSAAYQRYLDALNKSGCNGALIFGNDTASDSPRAVAEAGRSVECAVILYNLGVISDNQGRTAEADQWYLKAARLDRLFPDPRFNLGFNRLMNGRYLEAWEEFDEAAWLTPRPADIQGNAELALAKAIEHEIRGGRPFRAESLMAVLALRFGRSSFERRLGAALGHSLLSGRSVPQGLGWLRAAARFDERDSLSPVETGHAAAAGLTLGRHFLDLDAPLDSARMEQLKEASRALNECALRNTPLTPEALFQLAQVYDRMGGLLDRNTDFQNLSGAYEIRTKALNALSLSIRTGSPPGRRQRKAMDRLIPPLFTAGGRLVDTLLGRLDRPEFRDSLLLNRFYNQKLLLTAVNAAVAGLDEVTAAFRLLNRPLRMPGRLQSLHLVLLSAFQAEETALQQDLARLTTTDDRAPDLLECWAMLVEQRGGYLNRTREWGSSAGRGPKMEKDLMEAFRRLDNERILIEARFRETPPAPRTPEGDGAI